MCHVLVLGNLFLGWREYSFSAYMYKITISRIVTYGHLWQAAFPSERLGMGAFRIALESIFNQ